MEEEIALLEEQLASAHADIERLQEQLADAAARAGTHQSEAAALKHDLEAAQEAAREREELAASHLSEIEALRASLAESESRARGASSRYRELLLASEPALPADLVEGDSVEAIDAAVERARQTVAQVRQHLEQEAEAIRVPAGAPPRGAPDVSELSPGEKIRLGLEQR